MKKTKILSLILAFFMMLASVGVFAEETPIETPEVTPIETPEVTPEETPEVTPEETPEVTYQLPETAIELRDNIAAAICNTEDGWTAFDMAVYEELPDSEIRMSKKTKQKIINSYIEEATSTTATASDRARIEIVLSFLGIDSTELYPIGSAIVNNAALLESSEHTSGGHYAAPWILLAELQDNIDLDDEQIAELILALDTAKGDGTFGYEWDGVTYADPDTSGAVLAALAPLYETNDDAKALVDAVLEGLGNAIGENGSFGSANSDAMVIIGLIAMGESPYEFKHETTNASVVDGLLSYVNEEKNGFTYYGEENYMATEQGFRALVALSLYDGTAYNIYDCKNTEKNATSQTMSDDIITLRDNIAAAICNTEDGWTAFDMAAYEKLSGVEITMSEETKQKILDDYINEADSATATVSDRARIEIVLRSIGINSKMLYKANADTPIDNAQKLKLADHTAGGHYAAPWILFADMQGNTNLSTEQIGVLIEALDTAKGNGLFGYEWEGVVYNDPDTAAATIAALSRFYETNDDAKALVDTIFSALTDAIDETGSFGSANSDAMVIIGLIAMGENPAELKNSTSKKSVIDGLLSYANEGRNGFTYYGEENYMATEQGFRALVTLSAFDGEAINIYDFSENEVTEGRETQEEIPPAPPVITGGGSSGRKPQKEPEEKPDDEKEEVSKIVFGDTENHWAKESIDYVVKLGIMNGMKETEFAPDEKLTRGMLVTMLYRLSGDKNSGTCEFNDVSPDAWYKDAAVWASENGITDGYGDGKFAPDDYVTREQLAVFLKRYADSKRLNFDKTDTKEFEDAGVISSWAEEAILWAQASGVLSGRENNTFDPSNSATRAEIATVFMRFIENATK